MVNKRACVCAAVYFAAALTFWFPSVLIHAMRGPRFGVLDVLVLSIACPAIAGIVFAVLCVAGWDCSLAWRTSMFLLGVWMWGPPSMIVSATFSGGGLHTLSDPGAFQFLSLCFVVSTPMMATYDGSLVALFIVTCVLAIFLVAAIIAKR